MALGIEELESRATAFSESLRVVPLHRQAAAHLRNVGGELGHDHHASRRDGLLAELRHDQVDRSASNASVTA